jgi:uncharacterized protein YciI
MSYKYLIVLAFLMPNLGLKPSILRSLFVLLFFLAIGAPAWAQQKNPMYDSVLAAKLGADDYGMKKYVLVILQTGQNEEKNPQRRDSLFAGHMANINLLVKAGKMVVAGPLQKNEQKYRGIFIMSVDNQAEALKLLQADPTIREGIFDVILLDWYGSAALPLYLDESERIWKSKP